jgi:hypothetical protein
MTCMHVLVNSRFSVWDGRTCRVFGGRTIERPGGAVFGLHRAHGDEE